MKIRINFMTSALCLLVLCFSGLAYAATNYVLRLDGDGDYMQLDSALLPSGNTDQIEYSILAWVKCDTPNTNIYNGGIYGEFLSTSYRNFLFPYGGNIKFDQYPPAGGTISTTNDSFSDLAWHHLAYTQSKKSGGSGLIGTLYIDGHYAGSGTPERAGAGTPSIVAIGARLDNGESYFHGELDELSFWSKGLTMGEIAHIMRYRLRGDEDSLLAYFNFDSGLPIDVTGNNVAGELKGDALIYRSDINARIWIDGQQLGVGVDTMVPTTTYEIQSSQQLNPASWVGLTNLGLSISDYYSPSNVPSYFFRVVSTVAAELFNPNTDLTAYYPFDGEANDYSGNGLNGVKSGNISYSAGNVGNACLNDGTGFVSVPYNSLLNSSNLTISAWVYLNSLPSVSSKICQRDDGVSSRIYQLGINPDGTVSFVASSESVTWYVNVTSSISLGLSQWHHVCAVYNITDGGSIWLDGKVTGADATSTGRLRAGSVGMTIAGISGYPYGIDGLIDDLRIYGSALTQPDIEYLSVYVPPLQLDTTPPANISLFTPTAGNGQVSLSWVNPADSDFQGVKILRKTGGYPTSTTDGTTIYNGTGTSVTDTGLTNGTQYYYAAFSYDVASNYANGATATAVPFALDTTPPANITSFTATAGNGQVSLSWVNPGDSDFQGVRIQRKTGGYPASTTDGTTVYNGSGTSMTDTGLSNGTEYYYAAFAYDEVPNYASGAEQSGTPRLSSPTFRLLHDFDSTGGYRPAGDLTVYENTLYGITGTRNSSVASTLYRINTDGTGYAELHQFGFAPDNAQIACGTVVTDGNKLFGMTYDGGANDCGLIYSLNINGTGFQVLHNFSYETDNGRSPSESALTIEGTTLYGVTVGGGSSNGGTVFAINTDGSGFRLVHSFNSSTDGYGPRGKLTLSDGRLYGVTSANSTAAWSNGGIFAVNTDGSGFSVLHAFSEVDGNDPCEGPLVVTGTKIYGITQNGGSDHNGVVYSLNKDGSGFSVIHQFTYPYDTSGRHPQGSLALRNGLLYGTTSSGSPSGSGCVFSMNPNGTNFQFVFIMNSSDETNQDYNPRTTPVFSGTSLYATTTPSSYGCVFRLDL